MLTAQNILHDSIKDRIATLTLNRPEQYNALSFELLLALSNKLNEIADNQSVSAIIIQANGKAFCAGHDLKQMRQETTKTAHEKLFSLCSKVMMQIRNQPQPVIAKVHGMATAAGCQLVATCDLAVAVEEANFAVSGIRVGLFCSTPAVALSRNIGQKRALEMLLTGEFISAQQACEYGLINQIVASHDLDTTVDRLAQNIVRHPDRIIKLGKELFYQQADEPLQQAYCRASQVISENMMLPETLEGIDAFIEKRPPNWH